MMSKQSEPDEFSLVRVFYIVQLSRMSRYAPEATLVTTESTNTFHIQSLVKTITLQLLKFLHFV